MRPTIILSLRFLAAATLTFGMLVVVEAVEADVPVTAAAFAAEAEARANAGKRDQDQTAIDRLVEDVLIRLEADAMIFDRTLNQTRGALESLAFLLRPDQSKTETDYSKVIVFLQKVAGHARSREQPDRFGLVTAERARLLALGGDHKAAAAVAMEAADALRIRALELDQVRLDVLQNRGWWLLGLHRKVDAEQAFLEVLSFPWTQVTCQAEVRERLRSAYISAGRGIIECRRNDATGLANLFFIPATNEELLPLLNAAKKEAGVK